MSMKTIAATLKSAISEIAGHPGYPHDVPAAVIADHLTRLAEEVGDLEDLLRTLMEEQAQAMSSIHPASVDNSSDDWDRAYAAGIGRAIAVLTRG